MGKSQFKIAANLVVNHCLDNRYRLPSDSDYFWAYVRFFEELNTNFDIDKFDNYIQKRI